MRDLTVRGRCFLAAGIAAVICGVQIGERDFVRIGLLALAVPLVSWLLVRRSERRVWVRRDLSSLRVEAGDTAQVQVELGPAGRRRTGVLLVEETLPEALGAGQQFLVDPLEPGGRATLHYSLHARHRGRYPVGPLHLHVSDPLGMADLDEELDSSASLLVTPRTEALPRIALTGRWAGAGENRARELLGGGSPDVTVREYRLGDDLRRVHWPTTARSNELMVRREEQEWQLRCTLLLDHRRRSHRGRGHGSSLEAAVSATASVLRHLTAQGFEVRLVTATGRAGSPGWHQGERGVGLQHQLERLAVLGAGQDDQLATDWVDDTQHGGMLVAVLGHLDDGDRRILAGLASAGDAAYAVVLDVAGWERHTTGSGAGLTHHHATRPATTDLRLAGWKAATLTREGSLPATWQELGR